jgi:hypothetical protein
MRAHFSGGGAGGLGFTLVPRRPAHWWSRTLYDFRLDPVLPLTWHSDTIEAQPDQHFVTDGGSIPKLVQLIPAFDAMRYARPYAFHDSAYKNHCWYERAPGAINCHKRPLCREEADYWLWKMLRADGASPATAQTVYRAVRAFGWAVW